MSSKRRTRRPRAVDAQDVLPTDTQMLAANAELVGLVDRYLPQCATR